MTRETESRDPIEVLAEEFLQRRRRGENPPVEEYARAHPDLATRIESLFPTLIAMEELGEGRRQPPQPALEEELAITQLGEYRILREIGRGGMGVVYEAEQVTLGRRVALKVLSQRTFPDEVHLERFRQEARAAARLHHTNIVPVFGVGAHDGVHYYAMQYIHGQTLADVLQEVRRLRSSSGRFSASQATKSPESMEASSAAVVARELVEGLSSRVSLPTATETATAEVPVHLPLDADSTDAASRVPGISRGRGHSGLLVAADDSDSGRHDRRRAYHQSVAWVGRQVAEALAYAHGEGILHRDIKPSNLLLDLRGTVWITDFGLAKADESSDLTASGNVVGTLRYMAPERFEGQADERSDVYGLGVTLYELLALRPAFQGHDRAQLIRDVTTRQPPRLRRLDPSIPRDLETIVHKAMAQSRRDRYESAAALSEDLRRFLNFEPITARPATTPERLWRWCQRKPTVAGLTGTIAVLTLALAIGGAITAVQFRKELDHALELLIESRLEEGRAWLRSGRPGQRLRSLAALREAAALSDSERGHAATGIRREIRNEMLGALSLMDLQALEEFETPPGGVRTDPELRRWATTGPDHAIRIYDSAALESPVGTLHGRGAVVRDFVFSPGGELLAIRYGGRGEWITIWDVAREEILLDLPKPSSGLRVAFTAEEELLAIEHPENGIDIRTLPDGEVVAHLECNRTIHRMEFDPTGSRLAVVGTGPGEHVVEIWDVFAETVDARLHHPDRVPDVAWRPDGELLAASCFDFKVHLWHTRGWKRGHVLEGHTAECVRVGFNRTGTLLASASWDSHSIIWDPEASTRLLVVPGRFTGFSRDGRRVGLRMGSFRHGVWRIVGGREYRRLHVPTPAPREKHPHSVAVSPDGRWLAAVCGHYGVRLWSASSPQVSAELEIGWTDDAAFTADGSALITSGQQGLVRWRIWPSPDGTEVSLGPPQPLGIRGSRFSFDAAGKVLAVIQGRRGFEVYRLDRRGEPPLELEHSAVHRLDVSKSGRRVVSVTWHGSEIRVWNTETGEREATFEGSSANARFSPDEKWLTVSVGDHFSIYRTGSWEERLRIERSEASDHPGCVAYTGDSRFLALGRTLGSCDLVSLQTGEVVARLEPPDGSEVGAIELSPAGDLVAVASPGARSLHVWDLRAMREELGSFDLDWSSRPLVAAQESAPLRGIEIDYGERRVWHRPRQLPPHVRGDRLITVYSELIELDPSAENYRWRAEAHRDRGHLEAALADLESALDLAPDDEEIRALHGEIRALVEARN